MHSVSMQALRRQDWPFDFGDDPAFFAAQKFGSPVSWGVCRRDVRRTVQPGDVVLFFSIQEKKQGGPYIYRFCALMTVKQKIKQTDIWEKAEHKLFRQYDNILIRPKAGGGWEHFEPGVPKRDWHSDWISRLTFKDPKTKEFGRTQQKGFLYEQQAARFVAENYVIFSTDRTESFICAEPRIVATCNGNGKLEQWNLSAFATKVKMFTVANTRGSLRTRNEQRAHRHSSWEMDSAALQDWRNRFIECLQENCTDVGGGENELVKPSIGTGRAIC